MALGSERASRTRRPDACTRPARRPYDRRLRGRQSLRPRRHRYGAPRDLVLGVTVILADGTIASAGGKVVKNVAGYDLGKLFCGSRGRLGLIARVSLRLHPRPRASERSWFRSRTPIMPLAWHICSTTLTPFRRRQICCGMSRPRVSSSSSRARSERLPTRSWPHARSWGRRGGSLHLGCGERLAGAIARADLVCTSGPRAGAWCPPGGPRSPRPGHGLHDAS